MSDRPPLAQVKQALAAVGPLDGDQLLDAVAAVCYLMASADGVVGREETARITETLEALSGSPEAIGHVQLKFLARAVTGRAPTPTDEIADLARRLVDPQQRRVALAYGAAVAFANGILDGEEAEILGALAAAFAIPPDEAGRIVEAARGRRS